MSDIVYSAPETSDFAARFRPFIARLADAFDRALAPGGIERELDALPDFLLRDIGVARCDSRYEQNHVSNQAEIQRAVLCSARELNLIEYRMRRS